MADKDPPDKTPTPHESTAPLPVVAPEETEERPLAADETPPIADAPEVGFPVVLRGYDRDAVDAYVDRTSALLEELQSSRSPQAAVRRALDRVGEETAGILRQAEETAEQMTARSRAKAEARELRVEAEKHVRALDNDTERIWQERQRLIDDTRKLADTLLSVADDAEERFPPEPAVGPTEPAVDEEREQPSAPNVSPEPGQTDHAPLPGTSVND